MSNWKKRLLAGTLVLAALAIAAVPYWPWDAPEEVQSVLGEAKIPDGPYVALTFDDGPKADTTPVLLDGLAQRGVHATFFVIGQNVSGNELLIQRMAGEGHQIGLHTFHHKSLTALNSSDFYLEVNELRVILTSLIGKERFMLRPPYGVIDPTEQDWAAAPIILWSVDPADWSDRDTARQVSVIVDNAQDGDIILLHDIYAASVETALQAVDALMAKGYHFVTVEELFAIRCKTPENGKVYRKLPPPSE